MGSGRGSRTQLQQRAIKTWECLECGAVTNKDPKKHASTAMLCKASINHRWEKFDSKGEYDRWCQLKLMTRASTDAIYNLQAHPAFNLKVRDTIIARFTPDFMYLQPVDEGALYIVEEFKGSKESRSPEYLLKAKLFRALYPQYTFKEVTYHGSDL